MGLPKRVFSAIRALSHSGNVSRNLRQDAEASLRRASGAKLGNLIKHLDDKETLSIQDKSELYSRLSLYHYYTPKHASFITLCALILVCQEQTAKTILQAMGFREGGLQSGTIAKGCLELYGKREPIFDAMLRAGTYSKSAPTNGPPANSTIELANLLSGLNVTEEAANALLPEDPFDDLKEEIRISFKSLSFAPPNDAFMASEYAFQQRDQSNTTTSSNSRKKAKKSRKVTSEERRRMIMAQTLAKEAKHAGDPGGAGPSNWGKQTRKVADANTTGESMELDCEMQ